MMKWSGIFRLGLALLLLSALLCGLLPSGAMGTTALAEAVVSSANDDSLPMNLPENADPALWGVELQPDGTLKVHAYYGTETQLTVPSRLMGLAVTAIEFEAVYPRLANDDPNQYFAVAYALTLPQSVTRMEGRAPDGLHTLTIQGDVESLPANLFYNHDDIREINITGSVGVVEDDAICYSDKLETVNLGSRMPQMPEYVFFSCDRLESVTVAGETYAADHWQKQRDPSQQVQRESFTDEAGYRYTLNDDGASVTMTYVPAEACVDGELILPSYWDDLPVTVISTYSLGGDENLTKVTLPSRLQEVTGATFDSCVNLTEVVFPDTIRVLDQSAFMRCESLAELSLPEGLTTIGSRAFYGCTALKNISLPKSITHIGDAAFEYCTALTAVELPEGLVSLGRSAFGYCQSLKEITIPAGITTLPEYAFESCTALRSISLPDTLTVIGPHALENTAIRKISLPQTVTSIGKYAFGRCASLESVVLPEGVTELPDCSFTACQALTTVTLPQSITTIGENAFNGCKSLSSCKLPEGLVSIGAYAFSGCERLRSLKLPQGLLSIGRHALDSTGISSLTMPPAIIIIPQGLLANCDRLTELNLAQGTLYLGNGCLKWTPSLSSLKLPEGMQVLASESLEYSGIRSLTIPATMTHIGPQAMVRMGATSRTTQWLMLKKLTMNSYDCIIAEDFLSEAPDIYLVEGYDAYNRSMTLVCEPGSTIDALLVNSECIKKDYLPLTQFPTETAPADPLLTADWYAGRSDLTEVIIPEGVVAIEDGAFAKCRRLISVTFPSTLQTIGRNAFAGCGNLTTVVLPDSVTALGTGVFILCKNLKEVTLPTGLTEIPEKAFAGCYALQEILIPEGVTELGTDAFGLCDLRQVTLPQSLTAIGNNCFAYNRNLTAVALPDGLSRIGIEAFIGCKKLKEVVIPAGVTALPSRVFMSCSGLRKVVLPEGLLTIGSCAFQLCGSSDNPMRINLPASLQRIADDTFLYCGDCVRLTVVEGTLGESFAERSGIRYQVSEE